MIGSALSYVALRLLGEGPDDGEGGAMSKARKWILDNGGATGIPSWGKTYLSVIKYIPYFDNFTLSFLLASLSLITYFNIFSLGAWSV